MEDKFFANIQQIQNRLIEIMAIKSNIYDDTQELIIDTTYETIYALLELILVCIFKEGIDVKTILNNVIREEDLLFAPEIVGKEYWTRGLFHNIDRYTGKISIEDYCFYSIGKDKIYDEYGNEIALKKIICTYGVATIFGIGILVGQELLIEGEQL